MTDQTPDSPPRPQYGEYATPEEQRARIRQPDATTLAASAGPAVQLEPTPPAVVPGRASAPAATAERRPRPYDRIITFALLAYGLVNVVTSIPALVDYGAYTDTVFRLLGVDVELSDPAAGRPWGIAAAIILAVGWAITAALSLWSLRRGRLTWWIPLVGGIVFTFACGSLMLVPLMSDPAVWDVLVGSVR
ncbi:DUF6264 family protein [Microbacterium pumilum]|uniref:Uncharacterized protein n=1 Tax=Microbacterium pumilum TaxID=344165 RepID=A0ABN2SV72_9MICO